MEKEIKTTVTCFPETRKTYEAPVIEIVEVNAEQGVKLQGPPDIEEPNSDNNY